MITSKQSLVLRVTNSSTFIDGKIDKDDYRQFKEILGYIDPNAMWKSSFNAKIKKKWDGIQTTVCYNKKWCRCSIKKDGMHFPSGLIGKAVEFFKKNNIPIKIIDHRAEVKNNELDLYFSDEIKLYDYQEEVSNKACEKGRGIIKLATGGGKTAIAASIIQRIGVSPTVFYVISKDLLFQAKNEIEKLILQNGKSIEVGVVGGGKKDIKDINVMTIQTAIRSLGGKFSKFDEESDSGDNSAISDSNKLEIKNLIEKAKLIFIDECHHVISKSCQTISDHSISAKYRYGLSATPVRDLEDDILIEACFGKQICDINASFLIKRGFLVKPEIAFIHHRKKLESESYHEAYKEGIINNEERNLIIANLAKGLYDDGRMILILIKNIEHGIILEKMIKGSFFIHGSHTNKERKNHLELMRNRKAKITIASNIYDEGVDIRPLDALILAGSGKSSTRALQRVGRVIRKFSDPNSNYEKKDAVVIDFYDKMKYMLGHSRKRRNIYETESEFIIKDFK